MNKVKFEKWLRINDVEEINITVWKEDNYYFIDIYDQDNNPFEEYTNNTLYSSEKEATKEQIKLVKKVSTWIKGSGIELNYQSLSV